MKLEVQRFSSQSNSTLGMLFDVTGTPKFLCYTLEDEFRDVKVSGETRIPSGTYNVTLMVMDNEGATNSTTFNLIVDDELYSEINAIQITGNVIYKANYGYIILLITAIMIFIILSTRTTLDDRKKIV